MAGYRMGCCCASCSCDITLDYEFRGARKSACGNQPFLEFLTANCAGQTLSRLGHVTSTYGNNTTVTIRAPLQVWCGALGRLVDFVEWKIVQYGVSWPGISVTRVASRTTTVTTLPPGSVTCNIKCVAMYDVGWDYAVEIGAQFSLTEIFRLGSDPPPWSLSPEGIPLAFLPSGDPARFGYLEPENGGPSSFTGTWIRQLGEAINCLGYSPDTGVIVHLGAPPRIAMELCQSFSSPRDSGCRDCGFTTLQVARSNHATSPTIFMTGRYGVNIPAVVGDQSCNDAGIPWESDRCETLFDICADQGC